MYHRWDKNIGPGETRGYPNLDNLSSIIYPKCCELIQRPKELLYEQHLVH